MHRIVQDFFHQRDDCNSWMPPTEFSWIHIIQFIINIEEYRITGMVGSFECYRGNRDIQTPWCCAYPISAKPCSTWCWHAWLQWLTPSVWTYHSLPLTADAWKLGFSAWPKLQTKDYKKIPVLVINDRGFPWTWIELGWGDGGACCILGIFHLALTWYGFTLAHIYQSIIALCLILYIYIDIFEFKHHSPVIYPS